MLYTIKSDTMENADGMQSWAMEYEIETNNIMNAVAVAIKYVYYAHEVVEVVGEDNETVMGYHGIDKAMAYKTADDSWELHFHHFNGCDEFGFVWTV